MRCLSATLLLVTVTCTGGRTSQQAARPPNFVVILADDLGYADVGFQGLRDFKTPHIDSLAASGVRFPNAYVTHTFCSPSRAGLLSGRYQHRFGHIHNPAFGAGQRLPLSETPLPAVLAQEGYVSGIVGKWHLGDAPKYHPLERGFDEFLGFVGGAHDYFESDETDTTASRIPLHRNRERISVEGYLTDQFSDAAVDFLDRHARDRFFLYLAYNAPHTPLQAPPAYLQRVSDIADDKRRMYAAMVTAMDDGVGRVMEALDRLGLMEETLVFFLSDNGGLPDQEIADNAPLRGGKGVVYEGGVRVPFVASWRSRLEAGSRYDRPVSSLDIFATIAALAQADAQWAEGVNLIPYLEGRNVGKPHERLFWYDKDGSQFAMRVGDQKIVQVLSRPPELYDVSQDISESADLAESRSQEASELAAEARKWVSGMPPAAFLGRWKPGQPLHPLRAAGLGASEEEIEQWASRSH